MSSRFVAGKTGSFFMQGKFSIIFAVLFLFSAEGYSGDSSLREFAEELVNLDKEFESVCKEEKYNPGDCEKDFEDKYGKLLSLDDKYSLLIENKISDCDSRFAKFADFESSATRDAVERNIGAGIKTYYMSYNHADNIILIFTNYYNRTSPYNNSKFSFPLVIHIVIFSAADNKTVFRSKLPFPEGIPCSWSMSKYYRPYFLGIHFLKNDFIPDIYVLFGPGGSGNFASIFRYHYNPSTKTWDSKKIWHDKTGNIYSIDRRKVIFSANDKDFLLTQEDYWP